MANEKKLDVKSLVIIALLAVTLVLCIVGVCITWIKMSGNGMTWKLKLSDLADLSKQFGDGADGKLNVMYAFAIITVIVSGITAVTYAVSKFINVPVLKKVVAFASGFLVVCALLTIVFSYVFIGEGVEGVKFSLVGGWMVGICGAVNGIAGAFGAIKA